MRIRPLLIVSALVLTSVSTASPAVATPRPDNGEISFGRSDPALGDFSIWVANPDGTHQRHLTSAQLLLGLVTERQPHRLRLH